MIKRNEIKRREFLIRARPEKGGVLNLQEWPRKFFGEKYFREIFVIMPNLFFLSPILQGTLTRLLVLISLD